MTVDEARAILNANNLVAFIYTGATSGEIYDTSEAFVISQTPKAFTSDGKPNKIKMGDIIELLIKQKPDPSDYDPSNNPAADDVKNKEPFDPEEDK